VYCLAIGWVSAYNQIKLKIRMTMKRYVCLLCGYVYDEAKGWPEDGIEPGTRWEDVPDDWLCPDCGATKMEFEMVAVS
jgi:rubredoxin